MRQAVEHQCKSTPGGDGADRIQGEPRATVELLGVEIDVLDTGGLLERAAWFATGSDTRLAMYVNADCMLLARDDKSYRQALCSADLVYADGVGVVYGARLFGHHLPGRSTGADFMPDFCRICARRGLRLYFLGAEPGVAQLAAEKLGRDIPGLRIVGSHHGYFTRTEEPEIVRMINAADPDILIVGMGAPRQELWMCRWKAQLACSLVWGVGGLFDFLSGRTRRGPQWLLDHGFEWLCRLFVEPGRLWRRYLLGNTRFVFLLFRERFRSGRFNAP